MLPFLVAFLSCEPMSAAAPAGLVVSAPTYEGRAERAWAAMDTVEISKEGAAYLAKVDTAAIAVDDATRFSGLPEGKTTVDIRSDPVLAAARYGTDEDAFADALRQGLKAKVLVVHTGVRASFDRDSHVLSRLYRHDELRRFQLARIEDGAFIYLIVDKPLQFSPELATQAIAWVRASLAGENPPRFQPIEAERSNWQLVTSVRAGGQELAFSLAEAKTLDRALMEVVDDLETMHRRQREILGFPKLRDHIHDMRIEMHRVRERAFVVPRDEDTLQSLWEMGVDGAILLEKNKENQPRKSKLQKAVWPGSVAATRAYTKAENFLKALAREFRWDSIYPWRDDDVSLEMIRTVHYLEIPGEGVVELVRGSANVPLEMVNLDVVRSAIIYSGEWYLRNLQADGSITYKFWPEDSRYSDEYNHVRHELGTWNMWQAWKLDPRPEFMEGAIRAQNWTLRSLQIRNKSNLADWEKEKLAKSKYRQEIEEKGMAYFTYGNNTKLGSVVVGLFGMIEVARSTNDHSKDELIRQLARFVLFSQEENGFFRPYHVPPGHSYEFERNDIVPGEAALSLVYLYHYFDDPQYLDALPAFFRYYQPWFEERASKRRPDGVWPAYIYDNDTRLQLVQFGPWTVMAADAYVHARPQAKDVAAFGLEVAQWMVDSYEYRSDRTPWSDYVGGYYKFEGELPAMQAFCYAEGTAAAYNLALLAAPERAAFFERATRESVRFGLLMQHDAVDTTPFARRDEVQGGTKYALNEPKVRIDYSYHMQSALWQWLLAAEKDPNLPGVARARPDEKMRTLLRWMDMPGYRAPGAPVRTSVRANPDVAGVLPEQMVDDAEDRE